MSQDERDRQPPAGTRKPDAGKRRAAVLTAVAVAVVAVVVAVTVGFSVGSPANTAGAKTAPGTSRPGTGVSLDAAADATLPTGTLSAAGATTVTLGSSVTFNYTVSAADSTNWVGLYPVGTTPNPDYTAWAWAPDASGTTSVGTGSLTPGIYDAYLLYNDGYSVIAGPVQVVVTPVVAATAAYGTPSIDGADDPIWDNTQAISISASDSPITATTRFLWDAKYLYVLTVVNDDTPYANVPQGNGQPGPADLGSYNDSVDIWVNWTDSTSASYDNATGSHFDITRSGVVGTNFPANSDVADIESKVVSTPTQYAVEAAIPWPTRIVRPGSPIGLNTSINDVSTDSNQRSSYITWDTTDQYWNSPADMPTVQPQGGDDGATIFSISDISVLANQAAYGGLSAPLPIWPDLVGNSGVTYSSSDTSVATVDAATGTIDGLKPGTAVITAQLAGRPDQQLTVHVVQPGTLALDTSATTKGTVTFKYTTQVPSTGNYVGLFPAGQTPSASNIGTQATASGASGTATVSTVGLKPAEKWDAYLMYNGGYQSLDGPIAIKPHQDTSLPRYVGSFTGTGEKKLDGPQGVALDSHGDLWVADTGNNRVVELSPAGKTLLAFGTKGSGDGQFNDPQSIGVDSASGDVWVADYNNDRIEEFTTSGKFVQAVAIKYPNQLAVANGTVYVATGDLDAGGGTDDTITEYSATTGALENTIEGSANATPNQLLAPQAITVDKSGDIWVVDGQLYPSDNEITEYSPSGALLTQQSSSQNEWIGTTDPSALAFAPDGDLYIAEQDFGYIEVDRDGTTAGIFGLPDGAAGSTGLQFPQAIAVGPEGQVYVADRGNNRIAEFIPPGQSR